MGRPLQAMVSLDAEVSHGLPHNEAAPGLLHT